MIEWVDQLLEPWQGAMRLPECCEKPAFLREKPIKEAVLLGHHRRLIEASGISGDTAAARGYASIQKKAHLRQLGFSESRARVPALLCPLWDVHGELTGYLATPDVPRVDREGRPVREEIPGEARLILDVPLPARQQVQDPQAPLWIATGVRKADAAVSRGLCCVAVLGLANWPAQKAKGSQAALPGWESIPLTGRRVHLVLDSDVTKLDRAAALRLQQLLESRGAEVRLICLPPGESGAKLGLDDYLAAGHTPEELLALSTRELTTFPEEEDDGDEGYVPRYEESAHGIIWNRPTKEGIVPTELTNFLARIVSDVQEDDGTDQTRRYDIRAVVNGRVIEFPTLAQEFKSMAWVSQHLGAGALLYPGSGVQDHARTAIQLLSIPVPQRTVYTHLGWRKLGDEWIYLHTAGAIGPNGAVEGVQVNPPRGLEAYRLPAPGEAAAVREAIRRSLGMLEIAPREQMWPLLAAVYAAPLAEPLHCDFAMWFYGPTGSRKSTLAALLLCHFGQFDRYHLPANFTSTANAVELVLFAAKDALLVVDDYAPPLDAKTAAQQDNVAYRLLRGIGDTRGRNRATADAKLRGEKAPRALPLVTAELPPPGSQSSEARTLQVEARPESMDLARLTRAQQEDASHYPVAMAAFLSWLAQKMDTLRPLIPAKVREVAQRFPGEHGRCRDSAAKLYLGLQLFLNFAQERGAITVEEKRALLQEAFQALAAIAERTGRLQAERRPTVLFLENLRALLAQGRGYLADRATGEAPGPNPNHWGYSLSAEDGYIRPQPGAEVLGWVDPIEGMTYLLPMPTHRAVTRYSQGADARFPVTLRALGEHLEREQLLARKSESRREYRVRIQGKPMWCWAIPAAILFPDGENSENHEND